jgi:hypothetical protein
MKALKARTGYGVHGQESDTREPSAWEKPYIKVVYLGPGHKLKSRWSAFEDSYPIMEFWYTVTGPVLQPD